MNVVDVDSRELVTAWLLLLVSASPAIMRTYDVEIPNDARRAINKKIIFKNPWDVPRRFVLSSSNEDVMKPR